ncbi:hypothetical protein C1I95_01540 [Micromonospora craterilacus]|uniref:Uncharacterized protein n=2 Tax=Micromonospora craterilacus TaxID=1655439 RepID=A0A2W2GB88_9ACTN|nr:hypothetical protein C1I95_01540 [Micromonospora craterilacus]
MYNGIERLHALQTMLIESPHLRPYFYSNEQPPDDRTEEGIQLLLVAEMLGDILDYGLMTVDFMPPVQEYEGWRNYANFLYDHSPILRRIAFEHPEWWVRLIRHWQETGRFGQIVDKQNAGGEEESVIPGSSLAT